MISTASPLSKLPIALITPAGSKDLWLFKASIAPLSKNNLPFVFPSVAYKKGTDIIQESQQYRLCLDLLDAGHKVHVLDDSLKDVCDDRILYSKPTGYFFNVDLWLNF